MGQPYRQSDARREYYRKYYAEHPEYAAKIAARSKARRDKARAEGRTLPHRPATKTMRRAYQVKACFGLTREAYVALLTAQHGRCAICRAIPFKQHLAVDHDHATGKIRGLLCRNCNTAIGLLNDNLLTLASATSYLEKHNG